jgi:hypothetical protein
MKKIISILSLSLIVSFTSLFYNTLLAETPCEKILENELMLDMAAGAGRMFIKGYNYGKNTDIKYYKSKMKDFIRDSCLREENIGIEKIFANAVDTNLVIKRDKNKEYISFLELIFFYSTGEAIRPNYIEMLKNSSGDDESNKKFADEMIQSSNKSISCISKKLDNKQKKYFTKLYKRMEKKMKTYKSYKENGYLIMDTPDDWIYLFGSKKKYEIFFDEESELYKLSNDCSSS